MSGEAKDGGAAQARLAFGHVVRDKRELPTDTLHELRSALVPGTRIERHRRAWRMGQTREDEGLIFGRIGFESTGTGDVWNADANDFEERQYRSGVTSPFAIQTAGLRIAFQLKPATIKRQSFIGAFQALLREASGSHWTVDILRREIPFGEWRQRVDRIVELRFRLERPNPHYADRDFIEGLVDGAGSWITRVALRAAEDDPSGLNIDSTFIAQAVEHADQHGTFKATGERQVEGVTDRVTWVKGPGEEEEKTVGADPDTGEVPQSELRRELTAGPGQTEAGERNDDSSGGPERSG